MEIRSRRGSSQGEDLEEPCQDNQNQHFSLGIEDDCLADAALQFSAKNDVGAIACNHMADCKEHDGLGPR